MWTRTTFCSFLAATAIALISVSPCVAEISVNDLAEATRPNIIFVLTDDQGYEDVGFHGNQKIHTPRLDEFAHHGVDLTNFYVTPVCSTTRAGCLTGRYHYRTGVSNVGSCGDRLKANEVTIAECFNRQATPLRSSANGTWATTTPCGRRTTVSRKWSSTEAPR